MEEILTNQTAFNKVVEHMLAQGEQAYDEEQKVCTYWDESTGKKCAIGCLMTDEECTYAEGYGDVIGLMYAEALPERLLDLNSELLMDLQAVHDKTKDTTNWLQELAKVAVRYNLSMPNG